MLQPFIKFEKRCLDKLISLEKIYIVTQLYKRGYNHPDDVHRTAILLTDYDNPGLAALHLNAIKDDKFAAIIHLKKPKHVDKIKEMMAGTNYRLYWAVITSIADLQKKLDATYKGKLRKYIDEKTNWKIAADEGVKSQFEVIFGELFLVLKWRSHKVRLKFDEIEWY